MVTNLKILVDNLSATEQDITKALFVALDGAREKDFNLSSKGPGLPTARSAAVQALAKLAIAEILEKKSLGRNGTRVRVINQEQFKQLYEALSWED